MDVDGLVLVKVGADLEPFFSALDLARKETDAFDKEVGDKLKAAGQDGAAGMKELSSAAKDAGSETKKAGDSAKQAGDGISQVEGAAKKAATSLKDMGGAATEALKGTKSSAAAVAVGNKEVAVSMDEVIKATERGARSLGQYNVAQRAAAGGSFAKAMADDVAAFDKFRSQLTDPALKQATGIFKGPLLSTADAGATIAGLRSIGEAADSGKVRWSQYNIEARKAADPAFAARFANEAAQFARMRDSFIPKTPPQVRPGAMFNGPLLQSAMPQLPKPAEITQLAGGTNALTMAMARLIPVAVAAGTALAGFFAVSKYIEQSKEFEDAQFRIAIAIKNTGNVAGQSQAGLKAQADAIEGVTSIASGEVQKAQISLLRFKRVTDDVFTSAIKVAADYSVAMGTNMPAAAEKLGRVLEDPIRGMNQLRAAGVNFTKAQQVAIKSMVDGGNVAGAQKVIIDALKKSYDGYAEAERKTLGGAQKALGNAVSNLFELDPKQTDVLRESIERLIKILGDPSVQAFANVIGVALVQGAAAAADTFTMLAHAAKFVWDNLEGALSVFALAGPLAAPLLMLQDKIKDIFGIDVMQVAKDGVNFLIRTVMTAAEIIGYSWDNMGKAIGTGFKAAINVAIDGINWLVQNSIKALNLFIDAVNTVTQNLPEKIRPGIVGRLSAGEIGKYNIDAASAELEKAAADSEKRVTAIWKTDYVKGVADAIKGAAQRAALPGAPGGKRDTSPPPLTSGAADKAAEAYKKIVRGAQEYIEKQQTEAATLALTQQAQDEARHSLELLNKAKNANIKLTADQRAQLQSLAKDMAAADQALRNAKFVDDQKKAMTEFNERMKMEVGIVGMSTEAAAAAKIEYEKLAEARRRNVDITPELAASIKADAAAMAAMQTKVDSIREAYDFAKDQAKSFVSDMRSALKSGATFWEAFGQAINNVLDKVIDKIMGEFLDAVFSIGKSLVSGGSSDFSGGGIGGIVKGLVGWVGGLFGGGGGSAGAGVGAMAGIFHGGGKVGGTPPATRMVSASTFTNAPRFHSGLNADEFAAILQRGERVITEDQDNRATDIIDTLSKRNGNGQTVHLHLHGVKDFASFKRSQTETEAAAATIGARASRRNR